jgi:3-deoxy-D-manno-octulosonic-acid transferase
MFSLFYDLCLMICFLLALPKLLWQWLMLGKYRESLKAKLGYAFPSFSPKKGQEVIWIHAVSMGETRAVASLFQLIRKTHPQAAIVISTTTETGQAEAKRMMPEADAFFFLPLDFSWIVRRLIKQLQPSLLILCESDFWYHLLHTAKQNNVRIALVNGKVSERSCQRFQKVAFFTQRLFSPFDVLCIQSLSYHERFSRLGISSEKMHVTGNLKLDAPAKTLDNSELESLKASLGIHDGDPVLVIGSTHAPEEDWILNTLTAVWNKLPRLKVLMVPRHPERFPEVAHLFQEKGLSFYRFSHKSQNDQRLILMDAMGLLNHCYQIADLAIVGGSFVSHIGGHNIFEPVLHGVPVLFGPHMHNQLDLRELILNAGAGKEVSKEHLSDAILEILENPLIHRQTSEACRKLVHTVQGATLKTFKSIFPDLEKSVVV